jgi:Ni,Fe-hydrogenase III large subunit
VHAGVIEPGHFRFQCHGEEVFHLEIALGYQHRGIEAALAGGPGKRTIGWMETLAGDTTIGHTVAYCQGLERLAGIQPSARAEALRGIALELERLANHAGDMGALAGDVGYLPTMSFCGRIRGDFLNMTALVCGSRFGRGLVRPGGVAFDLDDEGAADLRKRLVLSRGEVREAIELLFGTSTVVARFEGTGVVSEKDAREIGLVGPAARASGLARDVRKDHPAGVYRDVGFRPALADTGDVQARAMIRWMEIQQSIAFVLERLATLPGGAVAVPLGALAPSSLAVSMTEGWRGEICHVALTGPDGRFSRYKVTDPSFHNWFGLALALREGQISDFPLCNKSFNLSYCGHDL